MRLILLFALLFTSLYAESFEYSDEPEVIEKVLYLNYEKIPKRLFKNEIFTITIKTLSTIGRSEDIIYHFSNKSGVKLLSDIPERSKRGTYSYATFYFQATSQWIRTPDIMAELVLSSSGRSYSSTLRGKKIDGVKLNPDIDFANILADSFTLTNYKTTRYDRKHNIAVFSATTMRCNIEDFSLSGYKKQGFESMKASYDESTMTYYAIIPNKLENLTFTYFNPKLAKFKTVMIPIIIDSDTVSTQTDLKPREHTHELIKMGVAGAVAVTALLMLIIRRKLGYAILIILPLVYIAYAAIPIRYACINAGSPIYLLPMENGTIFEEASGQYSLEVQGEIKGYTKVKLQNNKIGWVRHEDLCTP